MSILLRISMNSLLSTFSARSSPRSRSVGTLTWPMSSKQLKMYFLRESKIAYKTVDYVKGFGGELFSVMPVSLTEEIRNPIILHVTTFDVTTNMERTKDKQTSAY